MNGYISLFLEMLPRIVSLGRDLTPFVKRLLEMRTLNIEPTPADWRALFDMERPLRDELQKPV